MPSPSFYLAGVLLGVAVVVDAYEQDAVGVLLYLGRILSPANLVDGSLGILVGLQLDEDGW